MAIPTWARAVRAFLLLGVAALVVTLVVRRKDLTEAHEAAPSLGAAVRHLRGFPFFFPAVRQMQVPSTTPAAPVYQPVFRPIFFMHGIYGHSSDFANLIQMIQAQHPGTPTFPMALFEGAHSMKSLESQISAMMNFIRGEVAQNPQMFANGYNLVCHSQGGLICRALVMQMDDHNCHTLVSLAGPQMGVYGPVSYWTKPNMPGASTFDLLGISELAYWHVAQKMSVAEMWNNPFERTEFAQGNHFLPLINGLTNDVGNARRKANFLRLQRAVFYVGVFVDDSGDGGIIPSRSGVFDYYRDGSTTEYVPMKEQTVYTGDTFGLRTLDTSNRLVSMSVPYVKHNDWLNDAVVVQTYVMPHLA